MASVPPHPYPLPQSGRGRKKGRWRGVAQLVDWVMKSITGLVSWGASG